DDRQIARLSHSIMGTRRPQESRQACVPWPKLPLVGNRSLTFLHHTPFATTFQNGLEGSRLPQAERNSVGSARLRDELSNPDLGKLSDSIGQPEIGRLRVKVGCLATIRECRQSGLKQMYG